MYYVLVILEKWILRRAVFSPGAELLFSHEVKIRLLIYGHEQISIFTNITKIFLSKTLMVGNFIFCII